MKRGRYISFSLLLLFVAAFACRLSAGLLCSCEVHHAEEHHCCPCPEHNAECLNHDFSFGETKCSYHFGFDEIIAQLPAGESKSIRSALCELSTLLLAFCEGRNSCEADNSDCVRYLRWHQPLSSQCCASSHSLRAPPALV
ncbi:MAG: hypothetical protein SNI45_05000 [Rikenellaceae bacterium]